MPNGDIEEDLEEIFGEVGVGWIERSLEVEDILKRRPWLRDQVSLVWWCQTTE